jgi:molybdopterin synthase sulfur carrier subunit
VATVWVPSLLQRFTGGVSTVDVPGTTLREVINNLEPRYPGLKDRLLDDEGDLRPEIAAAIDGETEHYGLLEPVRENSEIHFIPAIGGGARST